MKVSSHLVFWNTKRENKDATMANPFHTLYHDERIKVEWISANRIALGLRGLIEILQIDEEGEITTSRVIKQIKHVVSMKMKGTK